MKYFLPFVILLLTSCGYVKGGLNQPRKKHFRNLEAQIEYVLADIDSLEQNSEIYNHVFNSFKDSIDFWENKLQMKEISRYSSYDSKSETSKIILFNESKDKAILNQLYINKKEVYNKVFVGYKKGDNWHFIPSINEFYTKEFYEDLTPSSLEIVLVRAFIFNYHYMDIQSDTIKINADFFSENGSIPIRFFDNMDRQIKRFSKAINEAKNKFNQVKSK